MIIPDLSNADYHARPEISKSGLDLIARSPAHYRAGFRSISGTTARRGSAVHALLLESGAGVVVHPSASLASKRGKDEWYTWLVADCGLGDTSAEVAIDKGPATAVLDYLERDTGLIGVSGKVHAELIEMRDAVLSNAAANELLRPDNFKSAKAEHSVIGSIDGVPARARPDLMNDDHEGGPILVDIKTTVDASPRAFAYSCAKYRYQVQAAFYSTLYQKEVGMWPRFAFVAVETTAPYAVGVYELDDDAIQNGLYLMARDLDTYAQCREADTWPGYEENRSLPMPIFDAAPATVLDYEGIEE